MPGPLNYTTKIPASKTIAEVHDILREHGADAVATTYVDRRVTGVRFQYSGDAFDLPVDVPAMQRILSSTKPTSHVSIATLRSPEHAERVAWRVIKDWLEAQMALVAAQQVTLDEVMLPYVITNTGQALRHEWRARLALPGGSRG